MVRKAKNSLLGVEVLVQVDRLYDRLPARLLELLVEGAIFLVVSHDDLCAARTVERSLQREEIEETTEVLQIFSLWNQAVYSASFAIDNGLGTQLLASWSTCNALHLREAPWQTAPAANPPPPLGTYHRGNPKTVCHGAFRVCL